jgi:hypothetical protein
MAHCNEATNLLDHPDYPLSGHYKYLLGLPF